MPPSPNVIELNYYIEQFERRLNAVDEAQSAVERGLDVALLKADIIEATEFRNTVREARVHATTRLAVAVLARKIVVLVFTRYIVVVVLNR